MKAALITLTLLAATFGAMQAKAQTFEVNKINCQSEEEIADTTEDTIKFVPPVISEPVYTEPSPRCLSLKTETREDSTVYVTEQILEYDGEDFSLYMEYGLESFSAQITVENREYNAFTDVYLDTEGNENVARYHFKHDFINGTCRIENDRLIFTPNETEKYETRTFKIQFAPDSKKIECLTDEKNNVWTTGECYKAQIMMGI
ncbi:MAG: hypothetical protein LBV47_00930 [Bacteroidales bacterium]|jgi:hypothetical protein|nr:hypothetical protein [Bacteroidales bacterium]